MGRTTSAGVKDERKASFLTQHRHALDLIQRRLDKLPRDDEKARKDLELQMEQLDEMMKNYSDEGPLLDVVLFQAASRAFRWDTYRLGREPHQHLPPCCLLGLQDGKAIWHAVVDIDGEGDLREATPIAPYGHARQVRPTLAASALVSVRGTNSPSAA